MRSATVNEDRMDDIHFRCVPYSAINELAVKLEPSHANNWSKLAEKISDFTYEDVLFIESKRGGDKTCTHLLFEDYMRRENATVKKVQTALEEMERVDAVQVLNKYMPEIERCHRGERNRILPCGRQPEENSYSWSSHCMHSQSSSICSYCCPGGSQPPPYYSNGVCRAPLSPPVCQHHSVPPGPPSHMPNGHVYNHPHPFFSGRYQVHAGNPNSDSLIVHNEVGGHQEMSVDVDMADGTHQEDPAPLPQGIMRGGNQLPSFDNMMELESMGRPGAIDVGREEVVKSSGDEVEYVDLRHRTGPVGRPGYFQQVSEEMNARQPTTQKRGAYIIKKTVNNIESGHSPSPPISKLAKLAKLPPQYQPNQNYKHIVANQKVDDEQAAMSQPIKEERIENPPYCVGYNQGNFMDLKKSEKVKNGMHDNKPRTFPRVKAHATAGPVVRDMSGSSSNSLTKSTSMPVDMKPAEFRKAWRYIKVFVTYSNDNKKHLQKVLSLCNCLVKNGFSCCVDVNSRYISTLPNQYDKMNWYKEKFSESDFILVCPSPKFKMEIQAQDASRNAPVTENQLHTRYIYKLMQQEYESQAKNTRFVPVLFEGMTEDLLPTWLQTSLTYNWPSQFKDLLWMLTRPEDRIKSKARLFSESSSQSNSPHHDPAF